MRRGICATEVRWRKKVTLKPWFHRVQRESSSVFDAFQVGPSFDTRLNGSRLRPVQPNALNNTMHFTHYARFPVTSRLAALPVAMSLLLPTLAAAQGAEPSADQPDLRSHAASLGDTIRTSTDQTDGGVDFGVAEGVVPVPLGTVMDAITGYGKYSNFMPNCRSSRVLSQRGNNAIVYLEASALRDTLTMWAEMRMYARPQEGDTRVIEGRMREGNLEHFVARWEVTPVEEGKTFVRFRILFVPDLPFPDRMVTRENVRAARRAVQNLRSYLTSDRRNA